MAFSGFFFILDGVKSLHVEVKKLAWINLKSEA
jgi:hypothetical protein